MERSEVDALAGRVAAVGKSEKSAASGHRAVRLVFVATALKAAAERGEPFAGELAAAQSLGADPKLTAALEPFAAAGVPRVAKPVVRPLGGTWGNDHASITPNALCELANVAMARAAASLRLMVGHQVLLSVPTCEILPPQVAVDRLAKPGNPNLVAVRQDFSGPFSGRALLIFPEAKSLELTRAVLGRQIPLADILDLEDEALAETGNIILNSWVATIANLLKQSLKMSLPIVIRRHEHHIFESATSLEESLIRGPRSGLSVAFRWRGRSLFQFLSHRQKLGGAIPQSTVRRLV